MIAKKENNVFHLYTNDMSYIIRADENRVISLYFGGKIEEGEYNELSVYENQNWSSIDGSYQDERTEFDLWDSTRFTIPCLKLAKQKNRMMQMHYRESRICDSCDYEELVIDYDTNANFEIQLVYRLFSEGIIERQTRLHAINEVGFETAMTGAFCLPEGQVCIQRDISGIWAGEWQIRDNAVTEGSFMIESRRGITGTASNPAIMLFEPGASEERGRVWSCMLAYSGNWVIQTQKTPLGTTRIAAGINDFDYLLQLESGEEWNSPSMFLQYSKEGWGKTSRTWHGFIKQHVMRSRPARPVLYNSWEATLFNVNCKEQMALATKAAGIGCERFVVDDGWFGTRDSDKSGLGDWKLNSAKFPNGLGELIDYVNGLGMDFGIWIEPEAVNPDSNLYRNHPDWVYHTDSQKPITLRNQYELNLSLKPVQEYLKKSIKDLLTLGDIRFIKWDMNRALTDVDSPFTKEPRTLWEGHVRGVYNIWREIREEFPNVEIETCAGGGNRVDMGSLSFTDEFWTSDNTDPFDRLRIQYGVSQFYPMGKAMCWVTDTTDGGSLSRKNLRYRFHSAMCGGLGIGANIMKYNEQQLNEASGYIEEYKKVRHIIENGQLYRIGDPSKDNLIASEYISNDEKEILVFLFLHSQSFFMPSMNVRLCGLDPKSVYCDENGQKWHGNTLMEVGIRSSLEGDYDSRMVLLKKK